jgi:hypothetical protein
MYNISVQVVWVCHFLHVSYRLTKTWVNLNTRFPRNTWLIERHMLRLLVLELTKINTASSIFRHTQLQKSAHPKNCSLRLINQYFIIMDTPTTALALCLLKITSDVPNWCGAVNFCVNPNAHWRDFWKKIIPICNTIWHFAQSRSNGQDKIHYSTGADWRPKTQVTCSEYGNP